MACIAPERIHAVADFSLKFDPKGDWVHGDRNARADYSSILQEERRKILASRQAEIVKENLRPHLPEGLANLVADMTVDPKELLPAEERRPKPRHLRFRI